MQHDASGDAADVMDAIDPRDATVYAPVEDAKDAQDAKSVHLAALLERISRHDAAAFDALYRASAPWLVRLAARVTHTNEAAEDVVQDGFIKIWRFAGSYDPKKSSPSTWMSAIVRNQALDYLRRSPYASGYADHADHADGRDERLATIDDTAERAHQIAHDAARLTLYLDCLTPVQRQAIALAYFRGQSQSEIARTLGAPVGTVKSWISRGLESLRNRVDGKPVGHREGVA
ncbi:MAG TPA: RNA polymerase sigma factor [Paraburkholderia sp.]|jgi:RNA polymerase sigma-70 factor (ECF subfamily)|nr:RNA polymerase sigma factor [Paraburkholderia sp.]